MRVIITGGTGLIGKKLTKLLARDGYDVVILTRNPQAVTCQLPSNVRLVGWDAKSAKGWGHLLDHPDTLIVNLAGHNPAHWRWTAKHRRAVLDSRIAATCAVVEAIHAAKYKPRALMQASAVGYYGDGGEAMLDEDSPAASDWRAEVCVKWEAVTEGIGIRTALLRIGIVLDQHGGAMPGFLAAAMLFGKRFGDGRQWVPWIHNADVAAAIHFLMNDPHAQGAFNLSAPEPARNADLMHTLAHMCGRPSLVPVPGWALEAAMGEQARVLLDSQRVVPHKLIGSGYQFQFPHLQPALHDILSHAPHWNVG